ncbi:MAG TPA: TetR family transcriptional regulator [Chryseolinea sp.]|nr:TetR family transcriptional regulator [Chryseolinea sp.]
MGRKSLKPIRQKAIIKAFYKVARKEGLENASIAKVASVLDVNPSLVIHYFKTKQDLIHGLIEYILERYRLIYNPENGTSNPQERLEKVIRNLFSRKWDKLFDDGVFYSSFSLIFRDKTLKSHYKNLHDHLRQMLTDTLKQAKEDDVIHVADVEKTADLIFIFVEGAYYYLSMVSEKNEYERRIDHYQQMVLSMLKFHSPVLVIENGK